MIDVTSVMLYDLYAFLPPAFYVFEGVWCAREPGFLYSFRPKRKGEQRYLQRGRKPTACH